MGGYDLQKQEYFSDCQPQFTSFSKRANAWVAVIS
jgi:hypothetical protein